MFCNNKQQQQQRRANIVTIHNVIVHINILVYLCNLVVLYIAYRHSHIRHLHIKSIYIFGYLLEAFCISLSHQIDKLIVSTSNSIMSRLIRNH